MNQHILRRYTNLPSALRILQSKTLTLLSPDNWDDRNDRNLIAGYKVGMNLATVLALCFARASDTYHHWKVFCGGTDGVCIDFDANILLPALEPQGVLHGPIEYLTIGELETHPPTLERYPFVKRTAFKDEREYRVLWRSDTERLNSRDFSIPAEAITEIVVNPWLPQSLVNTIRGTLTGISGFDNIQVRHSKIIDHQAWRTLAEKYASGP